MNDSLSAALYVVVLATALWSAPEVGEHGSSRRLAVGTSVGLAAVGVVSVVQLAVAPGLLDHLKRNRAAIADGQLWRLVTSLFVQDGGWPALVFNVVALALLGTRAEQLWGARRWLVVVAAAGIGGELWGLVVQPVGGGNSIVNFGLAASLAVAVVRRSRDRTQICLAWVCLLGSLVLLVTGDLHGGAAAIGAVAGWLAYRTLGADGPG